MSHERVNVAMSPRYQLYLIDWNGTIQDDLRHIYRCGVERIFREFGLPCPSMETYRNEVTADWLSWYHAHGIPADVTGDRLNAIMKAGFAEEKSPPALFEDAATTIRELAAIGAICCVISGYKQEFLDAAVARSGLASCFKRVLGNVKNKPQAFFETVGQVGMSSDLVAVVGDAVEDATAAAAIGAKPFICPRGFASRERIEAARSEAPQLVIIESLIDLLRFV